MIWTEPKPPTEGVSYYDHIICNTPLGDIIIDWKSWKDRPSYDVMLDAVWIGVEYDLEKAKEIAYNYLNKIYNELDEFLINE